MSAPRVGPMPYIHPYAPAFYVELIQIAQLGDLRLKVQALDNTLRQLPRWRWLRRFHLERRLFVAQLALECYRAGRENPF